MADDAPDAELRALLDVFHTSNTGGLYFFPSADPIAHCISLDALDIAMDRHRLRQEVAAMGQPDNTAEQRRQARADGFDDPYGAPFPEPLGGAREAADDDAHFAPLRALGGEYFSEVKTTEGPGGAQEHGHGGRSRGVDIAGLRWASLDARYSDKLGGDDATVSAPSDRGWHTTVLLQGGGNNVDDHDQGNDLSLLCRHFCFTLSPPCIWCFLDRHLVAG